MSNLANKFQQIFFFLLIIFLPTQLGKHFWFPFSSVLGIRIDYLSPTLYVTDIFLLGLLFIMLVKRAIKVSPFFLGVVVLLGLNVFVSRNPLLGWYILTKFIELSFLAWFIAKTSLKEKVIGIALAGGIIFESGLALLQFIYQRSVGGFFYFLGERTFSGQTPGIANASINGQLVLRPYATFPHPNMLAGYLLVASLLCFYFLLPLKKMKNLLIAVSAFATMGILLALSRVAFWAYFFCFISFLLLQLKRKKKVIFFFFAGVLALLVFLLFLFPTFSGRFFSLSFGTSLTERLTLAGYAFGMIVAHPLFGVGLGNFIPSLPLVQDTSLLQPVHNIYLLIAAEDGLPVFFVAFFFIWTLIQKLISSFMSNNSLGKQRIVLLSLALFVILFSGFFDHYFLTLQQGQLLLAIVVGLILRQNI